MKEFKNFSIVGLVALSVLLTLSAPTYGLLPADDYHRTLCRIEAWPDTYAVRNETWNGYRFYNNLLGSSYATLSLDESIFFSGSKSIKFQANSGQSTGAAIMYNGSGWDLSNYDILRVYVRGDVNNRYGKLRIDLIQDNWRITGGHLSAREDTDGATQFSDWTAVDVDLTQALPENRDNVRAIWLQMREFSGEGNDPVMWFDNVLLIKTISEPSFAYTGIPCEMNMSFAHADANSDNVTLRYGIDGQGLDNVVVLESVPGDARFSHTLTGLIPFRKYNYQLDDGAYVSEGSFYAESISLDTLIIEDFEGYADSAEMINSGRMLGQNFTLVNNSDLVYDGSKAGAFTTDAVQGYGWAGINWLSGPYWDLSSYDRLRIWYRLDRDNQNRVDFGTYDQIQVRIRDSGNNEFYQEIVPNQQNYSKWTYYDVEIDGSNPNWNNIGLITFYVQKLPGSASFPVSITMYVDRIEAIRDTVIAGDFDNNLSVDFDDIALIASQWLIPSDYYDFAEIANSWLLDLSCGVPHNITDIYISPDGDGHGLSSNSPTNISNTGIFNVIKENLNYDSVTLWFLDGVYENFRLNLQGIGDETNTLYIKGISEDGVVLETPETAGNLFSIRGCRNIWIENLNFTGDGSYGYALAVGVDGAGNPSYDVMVNNCNFYDMPEMIYGAFGVHNGSYNVTLQNSTFERVGRDSHSHMVYNANDIYNVTITNCYFEDTPGSYVRFRNADFGVITNNTFNSTGTYIPAGTDREVFIGFELFNVDPNNPSETFGTNYTITGNTFNFSPTVQDDVRIGIRWHNSGYSPAEWDYLLTPSEGAVLEGSNTQAKKDILLQNCGIDFSLITISGNIWDGYVTRKAEFSSNPYPAGYWKSTADISDIIE